MEGLPDMQLFAVRITDGHFEDSIHFLMTRTVLEGYIVHKKRELVVHTIGFSVIAIHLYKMGFDEVLR